MVIKGAPASARKAASARAPRAGLAASRAAREPVESITPGALTQRERVLAVVKQFRVVVGSVKRHYKSVEQASGVSGAQLWAMSQIAATPGIKVGQLAKELAVHQSTASNLLDRLEELAYISRERIADDRRVVRVFLTAKGARSLKAAPKPVIGVLQSALATLTEAHLDSLHAHLENVVHALKRTGRAHQSVLLSDSLADD